ncbi:hypothetical protein VPHD530_0045 [Vibrio phage D530]
MASSPDIPEAKVAAKKPERQVDVAPEDVKLGTDDSTPATGKKQLKRPRNVSGTGLSL